MNPRFHKYIDNLPELFSQLNAAPEIPISKGPHPTIPAIYILLENNQPVHVGRTRNLRQRLSGHRSRSHYSASFAFKRARRELGVSASYKVEGSRAELAEDPIFKPVFIRQIDEVRAMSVKYIQVDSKLDQYLLELYAVLEYDLPDDEFDTH